MTYQEARAILEDMRSAKRRANAIKGRIAALESDRDGIKSALEGDGMPSGGGMSDRVANLVIRIETEREKYVAALEAYFELEDKLIAAINTLEPKEKEVITAFYLDGMPNWKVGDIVGYSVESVKIYKRRGIQKIADNM